jgi:GTP1/Obg family GTP-binding protein
VIGLVVKFANEIFKIVVAGNNVYFTDSLGMSSTIDGLKLSYVGVVKEFPDLKDNEDWKKKASERFKEKIKSFNTDIEKINYLKEDLKQYGYKPLYIQRSGFRPQKV